MSVMGILRGPVVLYSREYTVFASISQVKLILIKPHNSSDVCFGLFFPLLQLPYLTVAYQ